MVDAWLLVLTIVSSFLILALSIYLFIVYSHPDDNKDSVGWLGRIIVIASIFTIFGLVMILPLDIANSRGYGGGLNMDFLYKALLMIDLILLGFFVPFTMILYETDEENTLMSRICRAFFYEIFFLIIVIVLGFIAYGSFKKAEYSDLKIVSYESFMTSEAMISQVTQFKGQSFEFKVPPFLFAIVFWIFFGWFIFVMFGGIGIIALPFDLMLDYFHRPRPRSAREIAERKIMLRKKIEVLMDKVDVCQKSLKGLQDDSDGFFSGWGKKRKHKRKENELKREMMKLENEYEIFVIENNLSANPLIGILKLSLGCLGMIFSFMVLIHLIFYKLITKDGNPWNEFLNDLFVFLEFKIARFVSTILFALISLYILLSVLKGNIKFGLRILLFMPIHPMKKGRTYINSFLFNLFLLLLCTPAIMHFIIDLFEAYMRLTSGSFIFTIMVRRMKFFKWFYENKVFFYIYLIWAFLTFVYLMCKPQSDRLNLQRMLDEKRKIAQAK